MIDLHDWPAPNGKKVTILLEEWDGPTPSCPAISARAIRSRNPFSVGDFFVDVIEMTSV